MPITKSRTISYLRPRWPTDPGMTLQDALRTALAALPTANQTRLSVGDRAAQVRHRRVLHEHVCLHVAAWTDREEASIVPHATNNVQEDLATQPPGRAWDYLNGDGMLLALDDHCLVMPSGLPPRALEGYVRRLIRHATQQGAAIPPTAEHFELLPIANERVVAQIRREGVKKLHLDVGQYRETATVGIEEDQPRRIVNALRRSIWESLVTREDHRRLIEEADNVTAKLVISLDRRRRGLEPEQLTPLVEDIVSEAEEEDDVQIETGSGQRIRRGRLVLKKAVTIEAFAETVHHARAWDAMVDYLYDLERTGALGE